MNQQDELLDTEHAADYVHHVPSTLRYWRHVGKGPQCFSMGGRKVFYRRSVLDAWIAEQEVRNSRVKTVA
jgi:prophage regulatory protein